MDVPGLGSCGEAKKCIIACQGVEQEERVFREVGRTLIGQGRG